MTYYMHTLDGKPAYFDGEHIYLIRQFGKSKTIGKSLRQIKREQQIDKRNSESRIFDYEYGYVRLRVPSL